MSVDSGIRLRRSAVCAHAGFTLIEMVIVMAIIAILVATALPQFMRYQLKSKSTEAKTNLSAIRVVEEGYFSEQGEYLTANPEPPAIPGSQRANFDDVGSDYALLGWGPEGDVYFSYGVAVSADLNGFTADAAADIDGDGIVQYWGYAKPDRAGAVVPASVGCNVAALVPLTIGPCDPAAGQSVF